MENYFRTFIGLPFSVEAEFLEARQDLIASLPGERISWVAPERYHVTLRFLGDTEQSLIGKIGESLAAEITLPERTCLKLNGLGSFGPEKRPRVLWVGFEESGLFELMKSQVDQALKSCGIFPVEQPYRAHLTLGRIRSLKNLQSYNRTVEEMQQEFKSSVVFDKLVFFRSILGSRGPEYQVLKALHFR